MADAFLERQDESLFIDWANGTDLSMNSMHRQSYIEGLRAADRYEFEPLVSFAMRMAKKY